MTCCRGSGSENGSWLDKMEPGRLGTYASYALLGLAMFVSIVLQQTYADSVELWTNGCDSGEYKDECMRNSAIFRFSMALTIVFGIQMIGTYLYPPFYDNMWVPKFSLFIVLIIIFSFLDSDTFNDNGYAWFARIAAFFFVIVQQIILLDVAYVWNERWVNYATETTDDDGNSAYLYGLLGFSALLFSLSLAGIAVMYETFNCEEADVIISLTLVLTLMATLIQIFMTDNGSLLTSAIVTAYATFICYCSLSLNPDSECNPTIAGNSQTVTRVVGTIMVLISLSWTTHTTVQKSKELSGVAKDPFLKRPPGPSEAEGGEGGSVPAGGSEDSDAGGTSSEEAQGYSTEMRNLLTEVAGIFLLVSCYFAMVITNWATEQHGEESASPTAGRAAMWLQASAQWIALALYLWTLVAPLVWPDRDFGVQQI